MVLGAMGVSLLPVVFLFFFSYALVNRTLNLWFPRPLEIANEQSQILLARFEDSESSRLNSLAADSVSRDTAEQNFRGPKPGFRCILDYRFKRASHWRVRFRQGTANAKRQSHGGAAPAPPKISAGTISDHSKRSQIWK